MFFYSIDKLNSRTDNFTSFIYVRRTVMFKEKGYDEFLTEQIRIGREQIKAGQGIPIEIAKQQIKEKLEKK